ncbi:protein FAM171B-like isoform X2 [Festucalex cinctus]
MTGTWTRPPPPPHVEEDEDGGNFSTELPPPRVVQHFSAGSNFNLKVQVTDMLTRQYLSQAEVDLYVNYTRTETVRTGEDGGVLLQVPFQRGSPVTVAACRDGYVCASLPYKSIKTPIFSSVTVPLLRLTQGNIWLFQDSFLITDKTADVSFQPVVQFPKSLLNLTEGMSDVKSLKAYLTIPRPPLEDRDFLKTVGIVSTTTGYVSMELNPVAAVSVRLFSGDTELHVSGPVKISLTLPDNCRLPSSKAVPAWLYNRTTGGWMRRGFGTVVSEGGKLSWTFTAPHLGYWIAAPVPTPADDILTDFFVQNSSFLMVVLGGLICVVACLLAGLLYCRSSARPTKVTHTLPLTTKDQSTSTGSNQDIFGSSQSQHGLKRLLLSEERRDEQRNNVSVSIYNGNIMAANAELNDSSDTTELIPSLTDSLIFYNQPVAILHASAFFRVEDQPQNPHWTQSIPLHAEKLSEERCKDANASQDKGRDPGGNVDNLETALAPPSRGQYGLLESASVPETLSQMRAGRRSMDAATELSSSQPPRAWFVSLEGKPAAEIRYAVAEQQQRRRRAAAGSQETSLDSGVDMIEMNPAAGRRSATLERTATFVKRTSGGKHTSQ